MEKGLLTDLRQLTNKRIEINNSHSGKVHRIQLYTKYFSTQINDSFITRMTKNDFATGQEIDLLI